MIIKEIIDNLRDELRRKFNEFRMNSQRSGYIIKGLKAIHRTTIGVSQ